MKTVYNFNAGPSILPQEVFQQASNAIINFEGSGLSILEFGHRTPKFEAVVAEARSLMKELMNLGDEHEVLFLHGGASTQFFQIPMNLLGDQEVSSYIDTGVWASKAIKEAKNFGKVDVVASSKDKNYNYLPKDFNVSKTSKYLHITSNNTIYGTQWQNFEPFYNAGVPLVADMSSDILSKQLDFNKFDLIYAGAQKNIGAAGVTIVVVKKDILGKSGRNIPTMLDYQQHIDNQSMLNTPPAFAIYVCLLTLRWLKKTGGIGVIEKANIEKADILYNAIDQSKIFKGTAEKEDRSLMNVSFVAENENIENEFLAACKENNFIGVKGHRSVGGFRASIYNAMSIESVKIFSEFITQFAHQKG